MSSTVVKKINQKLADKSVMRIGRTVMHPDGYKVKIIDGCFLDPVYGRVSNVWTWRKVKPDGSLGRSVSGYGW